MTTGTRPKRREINKLADIELGEVSLVDAPANAGARVVIWKSEDGPPEGERDPAEPFGFDPTEEALDGPPGDEDDDDASEAGLTFAEALVEEADDRALMALWDQLFRYQDALRKSLQSIVGDDTAIAKGALVRDTLEQFAAAVTELLPVEGAEAPALPFTKSAAGTAAAEAGHAGHADATGDDMTAINEPAGSDMQAVLKSITDPAARQVVEKALKDAAEAKETVEKMQAAEAERVAFAKAQALTHLPGDKAKLVELFKSLTPEQETILGPILKAASQTIAQSGMFAEIGVATANGGVPVESPIIKAARARAEEARQSRS